MRTYAIVAAVCAVCVFGAFALRDRKDVESPSVTPATPIQPSVDSASTRPSPATRIRSGAPAASSTESTESTDLLFKGSDYGHSGNQIHPFEALGLTHREVDELVGVFDEWTEKASELDAREQSGDLTLEEHDKLVSDLKDTYEQKVDQLLGDRGDLFVELSQNLLQERLQALSSAARGAEDSGSVEHFFGE